MIDLDLDDLAPHSDSPRLIKGKWCTIGFLPNPGSGERLNIGVAFKPNRGKTLARMVTRATGFRSIYGNAGVENFSFLIAVVAEYIQRTGTLEAISRHIQYWPLHTIQGTSSESILDSLYENLVTLRVPEENLYPTSRAVNTTTLRQSVIREMRRKHPPVAERFLHEQPIVTYIEDRAHLLDLPLWQSDDLVSGRLFGSIVSTHYMEEVYRQHDLDRAFRNVNTAKRFVAENGRGGLFILRPATNDSSFPVRDIDNDIDSVVWPLAKAGIHIDVEDFVGRHSVAGSQLHLRRLKTPNPTLPT